MVDWLNNNQGFLLVILTLVYVVATIVISYLNYKAISEQKKIAVKQQRIALFSVRYQTYQLILEQLHLWRFTNNAQVEYFLSLGNKVDVSLYLNTHCQDFFNVITQANLVFDKEVYTRLSEAWGIIKNHIYPCLKSLLSELPIETSPVDVLVSIKYKMREDEMSEYAKRLFILEAELSTYIEAESEVHSL